MSLSPKEFFGILENVGEEKVNDTAERIWIAGGDAKKYLDNVKNGSGEIENDMTDEEFEKHSEMMMQYLTEESNV